MRMVMFVLGLALFAFALIAGEKQMRDGGFAMSTPGAAPSMSSDQAGLMMAMMAKAKAMMGSGAPAATPIASLPQVSPQPMMGPNGAMPADLERAIADFDRQFADSPAGALATPMISTQRKATKGGARFVKVTPRN